MIYVNINVSDFLTFCEAIRGSTIVPSDMKKEAFKKTLELRPKTSQDLLEFYPKKKKKVWQKSLILSHTQHFQKKRNQEHMDSNSGNQWPYVLSGTYVWNSGSRFACQKMEDLNQK